MSNTQVATFQPPRLPYHDIIKDRFGIDRSGWKALTEAVFPLAKTSDSVVMALSYCKARGLDPFKRPVHIVPMYSAAAGGMVETVWPGIAELRTTAFRTKQFAGMGEAEFGPMKEQTFTGTSEKGSTKGKTRSVNISYPEWCRITVRRSLDGQIVDFVGPKVHWIEAYAKWADTDVPNDMWAKRAIGQLEKCAEAAALRRAFPEEIGSDYTAEEMEGQRLHPAIKDITPIEQRISVVQSPLSDEPVADATVVEPEQSQIEENDAPATTTVDDGLASPDGPVKVARDAGAAAFKAGVKQRAIPAEFRVDETLSNAWIEGWNWAGSVRREATESGS